MFVQMREGSANESRVSERRRMEKREKEKERDKTEGWIGVQLTVVFLPFHPK